MNGARGWALPALVVMAGAGEAMADDLTEIGADLDAAEKRVQAQPPGDVAEAKAILALFEPIAAKLKGSPAKGKPEWKALLERAQVENRAALVARVLSEG